jgi:hypothetical protein
MKPRKPKRQRIMCQNENSEAHGIIRDRWSIEGTIKLLDCGIIRTSIVVSICRQERVPILRASSGRAEPVNIVSESSTKAEQFKSALLIYLIAHMRMEKTPWSLRGQHAARAFQNIRCGEFVKWAINRTPVYLASATFSSRQKFGELPWQLDLLCF